MKKLGKVLFFNANDGQGIIITSEKEKINFSVQEWDDFDTMPSLGLEVRFMYEDSVASCIVSLDCVEETNVDNSVEENNVEVQEKVIEEEVSVDNTQEDKEDSDEEETSVENTEEYDEENIEEELQKDNAIEAQASNDTHELEEKTPEHEHFEEDSGISEIGTNEELEEELGEREESVTVTMNLPKAVSNYFNVIEENIEKRLSYKKIDGRLNYLVIKRFIWTTFNNLSEIDLHIITPKIKLLSDDLRYMGLIHEDFVRKIKYPVLAYEEVFLSCQAEYKKVREGAEKTIQRINQLKGSEKHLGSVLKVKKEELSKELESDSFEVLGDELKSLNGAYVDVVHMMAELDQRYKHDMKLLVEFEKEYKEDFYVLFEESAKKYKKDLVDILSAQAFTLDAQLWQQAKSSKGLKVHFHKAGINGEFNTRTYLKYFLDTQDSTKSNDENKKLFELYEYLISIEKEHILIILNDANDAMELQSTIKKEDKIYEVKACIDEKTALKWAIKHSVKVLILENELTKMQADVFLQYYKKYVLVIPKIILLGNNKKSDLYTIHKLLSRGTSVKVITQNVKELLKDEMT